MTLAKATRTTATILPTTVSAPEEATALTTFATVTIAATSKTVTPVRAGVATVVATAVTEPVSTETVVVVAATADVIPTTLGVTVEVDKDVAEALERATEKAERTSAEGLVVGQTGSTEAAAAEVSSTGLVTLSLTTALPLALAGRGLLATGPATLE